MKNEILNETQLKDVKGGSLFTKIAFIAASAGTLIVGFVDGLIKLK